MHTNISVLARGLLIAGGRGRRQIIILTNLCVLGLTLGARALPGCGQTGSASEVSPAATAPPASTPAREEAREATPAAPGKSAYADEVRVGLDPETIDVTPPEPHAWNGGRTRVRFYDLHDDDFFPPVDLEHPLLSAGCPHNGTRAVTAIEQGVLMVRLVELELVLFAICGSAWRPIESLLLAEKKEVLDESDAPAVVELVRSVVEQNRQDGRTEAPCSGAIGGVATRAPRVTARAQPR